MAKSRIKKIVFTGPESTGKSTTAEWVASQMKLPLVAEYAREYLHYTQMKYQKADLDNIAKMQLYKEFLASKTHKQIICDTDILTIQVWSDKKYKNTSFTVQSMFSKNDWKDKVYLLFYPDTDWVADPLRESPFDREELFNMYKHYLEMHHAKFQVIDGLGKTRLKNTKAALEALGIAVPKK